MEITQPGNKGGIDFDFDKERPDGGWLRYFLIKQFNAGLLRKSAYRPLLQDSARWQVAVDVFVKSRDDDG